MWRDCPSSTRRDHLKNGRQRLAKAVTLSPPVSAHKGLGTNDKLANYHKIDHDGCQRADAAEARETDGNTVVMAFNSQELTAPAPPRINLRSSGTHIVNGTTGLKRHRNKIWRQKQSLRSAVENLMLI